MLTYDLEKRGQRPIYEFLYGSIREDIRTGVIKPHERLPSKRRLAEHLNISVITVKNAYEQLVAEGYVTSRERGGYFAADLGVEGGILEAKPRLEAQKVARKRENSQITDSVVKYDLSAGAIRPSLFPFSVWSRLMRRVLAEQDKKLLERVPATGVRRLREAISDHLLRSRGLVADPERIVIGAGTEYLYNLIIQLLGRERVYALEDPGYQKIASILDRCGVSYLPVGLNELGMKPETGCADVIHLSPSHHYPTGIVMPAPRRLELLKRMRERDGYIIEDDYDSEFRFEGKMMPTMFGEDGGERVIYLNTFAETISPSLRISYMVLPESLMERFHRELSFYSCTVPSFEQYTLAAFLSEGYFEKHVNRLRLHYKQTRDRVAEILGEVDGRIGAIKPTAGLNFLLRLDTEHADGELKACCLARGVGLSFVSDYLYRPNEAFAHLALLNIAGGEPEEIRQALRILAEEL